MQFEFNLHSFIFYLCQSHNGLTNEADIEERRIHGENLDPGTQAGAHNAHQGSDA